MKYLEASGWCKLIFFMALLITVASKISAADSLGTIIIDAGYDKRTSIAIVPFSNQRSLDDASGISDIINFDLARSGYFQPLRAESMLSLPTAAEQVFFRDWRILGIEYLVIGRVVGGLLSDPRVLYEVYDVYNERRMPVSYTHLTLPTILLV